MKHGFMLMELMIATLIASMVAGILLTALSQSTRAQFKIDNVIDMSTRAGVAAHQLEKDLMGAFIPAQAQEPKQDKKSQQQQADKKEEHKEDKKETEQKAAPQNAAKKEPKVIEKIFYSTNKANMFDTFTWITNNPLAVYVGKDVGEVKSKVARVQYSLRPEPERKDSYALWRKESADLDLEQSKNAREYEVIGGIKNCTIKFIARIEKKQEEKPAAQGKQAEKPKKAYEYKELHEWVSERKKGEEKDKDKEEFPRVPYSVEMTFLLWDTQYKKTKEFVVTCTIPVDFTEQHDEQSTEQKPKKDEPARDDVKKVGTVDDKNKQSVHIAFNAPRDKPQKVTLKGTESLSHMLENIAKMFGQR